MRALKWALPYALEFKWRYVLGQIISLINIGIMLINPFIAGMIVVNVIEGGQSERLPMYLGIMIAATIYRSVTRYGMVLLYESTAMDVLFNLRRDVYHKLHSQNFHWFDKNRVGDIMSRMTGDMEAIRHFVAWSFYTMIENFILYVAAVVVMATISIPLTIALIATTPVLVYAAAKQSKDLKPAFHQVREQFSTLNSTTGENIGGNRVVKAFTKEEYEIEKFGQVNQAFFDSNMGAAKVRVKYFPIMETCAALLPWILLLFGGLLVIWGQIELWQMITLSGYLWMLNNPTRMINMGVSDLQNAATSLEKIFDMMRQEIEITSPESPKPITREKNLISFKDVSFKYNKYESGSYTLKDITFEAKEGQTIGIVGGTGSGKTTLMYLLGRFYDATKGDILVNNINVKDCKLIELRNGIAYAMQDVFLYSDSVYENIAFGVQDADNADIINASKIADADSFINEMEEGYDTIVGERGVGLSGGQKQRISLARAVATNPSVLILDDVTSAVDTETEFRIQSALKNFGDGKRITFIVAHRLSSVKHADQILVLTNGEITERGTHEELMTLGGYYCTLYNEQKGGA